MALKMSLSFIEAFRNKLLETAASNQGSLKVALFSHVVSVPTIVEHVEELTQFCRSLASSCLVLIDGAHSLDAVPVDIERIDCDFLSEIVINMDVLTSRFG